MSFALGTHAPRVTGGGAISRTLLGSREMSERNCSNLSAGLLRTSSLEQIVDSQHYDQQICVSRKAGAADGISRPFCPML